MAKKISYERWQSAQQWEQHTWDEAVSRGQNWRHLGPLKNLLKGITQGGRGNDRNDWWAQKFNNYEYIPPSLQNVVEFGCGPFTNLRLIMQGRQARYIFASDPLARHYVRYTGYYLSNKWKAGEYLIDDHPLEEAPFADNLFDLVVCINVLDHVQDPDQCLMQVARVTAPGGIILLGQDLTNEVDLRAVQDVIATSGSDIGHPHFFDDPSYLTSYFDSYKRLLHKVLPREEGLYPQAHFGTLIFAGQKPG